jgi:hypothetical protein
METPGSGYGPETGSFEYGNESLGFKQREEFLDYMSFLWGSTTWKQRDGDCSVWTGRAMKYAEAQRTRLGNKCSSVHWTTFAHFGQDTCLEIFSVTVHARWGCARRCYADLHKVRGSNKGEYGLCVRQSDVTDSIRVPPTWRNFSKYRIP